MSIISEGCHQMKGHVGTSGSEPSSAASFWFMAIIESSGTQPFAWQHSISPI
ncbi:hypothetical protein GYMLUDRAFT_887328 [Collybiopsis luxurians FD-317 M1]|uniref:Uncharacterized protein n=1 Tax=Collybiopsis luxurians FD-317 M1 TaxID=944289 RepID=A0A0D0CAJ3_9AGAR|nr:hypothetical protein GYMLUDRAFT_887328 [Collybiopsis luxurians FD-317 M1]